MAKQYLVNVYDEAGNVISRVRYQSNLDYWNGHDWVNGGTGKHKGLTRLEDGRYVLIHGSQWTGDRDWAEVVTPEAALQEILRSGNIDLLDTKKFAELKALYEQQEVKEVESEEMQK